MFSFDTSLNPAGRMHRNLMKEFLVNYIVNCYQDCHVFPRLMILGDIKRYLDDFGGYFKLFLCFNMYIFLLHDLKFL